MIKIKRALISVSDKTGLEAFVKGLHEFGVEMLSTGGTAKLIKDQGIPVRLVSDFTGSPEMLDGRVKTLHPKIHGGLLALREDKDHMAQVDKFDLELIDMVVVNLYPFEKTIQKPNVALAEAIENIDIGGPSMLRSAAKNSQSVAVICSPEYYNSVLDEMKQNNGTLSKETSFKLSVDVFDRTSKYDQMIASYLKTKCAADQDKDDLPEILQLNFEKIQKLRYGENPHQKAAFYQDKNSSVPGVATARQLHGKELSFNNILDLDAALNIVKDFKDPAAVIMKHNNPCGAATAEDLSKAYEDALACDPMSAFGSIVGLNRPVDSATAEKIVGADFVECVIAPGFSKEALETLKRKKNLRIMEVDDFTKKDVQSFYEFDFKRVNSGLLVQGRDIGVIDNQDLKIATKKQPSKQELDALLFAWIVVKHVKSNAIVLAQGTKTVGVGAGQMSRVDSVIISIRKSNGRCQGSVLASDAFFPKADAIEAAAKAGVTAVIQPGGSIRDQEVIDAADKAGISMVLTGKRHFRH
ncbi:MAG: bifunctional phosphoribosylaminoimidazolecarboxamide formyltransferase/IMP cyclohydrolase [PVC group bacterium]|nr:bifunctional phosphoribosylaminoimidazolecarboxamide formyltransferase/IMP cyclohydrolase [PVC group bacterium]